MKKKIKRAVHIDFHTMDGIENFAENFKADEFADKLCECNVSYINMFAQCNLGYSYYPTEIGVPYPYMKGDMFGDTLRECHKRGIGVTAYINVGFNGQLVISHPEWCKKDDNKETMMCFNSGEYREYLLSIVREIFSNYDADGLFCDCLYLAPCSCDTCRKAMEVQGIDLQDESKVNEFTYSAMLSLCKEIKGAVPEGKNLFFNGMPFDDVAEYESHIELECLPSGGWGYDFFVPQVSYARNINPDIVYMTGRFQAGWGDFGGIKTKASLENDAFDALSQCVEFSVGDHMHPANGPDSLVYENIKELYRKLSAYERWTDSAQFIAEVGVIRDKSVRGPSDSIMGVSRMLSELKYCFETINEDHDFTKYKLLILPDYLNMTDKLAQKLESYIDKGGFVLSSGFAGLNSEKTSFAVKQWGFIEFCGADVNDTAYYEDKTTAYNTCYGQYEKGIMAKVDKKYELSAYVEPYHLGTPEPPHGLTYNPPKGTTEYSAAMRCNRAQHISFPVFEAYFRHGAVFHKQLVDNMIKAALSEPFIKACDIPSTARITAARSGNDILVYVKATYPELRGRSNIIEEHTSLCGGSIAVRGSYSSVVRLPNEENTALCRQDGYTVFDIGRIDGFAVFTLS